MAVVDTLSEIYGSQTEWIDLENVFNKTVDIPGELFLRCEEAARNRSSYTEPLVLNFRRFLVGQCPW